MVLSSLSLTTRSATGVFFSSSKTRPPTLPADFLAPTGRPNGILYSAIIAVSCASHCSPVQIRTARLSKLSIPSSYFNSLYDYMIEEGFIPELHSLPKVSIVISVKMIRQALFCLSDIRFSCYRYFSYNVGNEPGRASQPIRGSYGTRRKDCFKDPLGR